MLATLILFLGLLLCVLIVDYHRFKLGQAVVHDFTQVFDHLQSLSERVRVLEQAISSRGQGERGVSSCE